MRQARLQVHDFEAECAPRASARVSAEGCGKAEPVGPVPTQDHFGVSGRHDRLEMRRFRQRLRRLAACHGMHACSGITIRLAIHAARSLISDESRRRTPVKVLRAVGPETWSFTLRKRLRQRAR